MGNLSTIRDFRMMWEERRDDQEKLDDGRFSTGTIERKEWIWYNQPKIECQKQKKAKEEKAMSAAKKTGVIYILTNPSFPDYVKIGYATDIEKRLKQLNRSECIPFAFRVYATYDVSTPLQDRELHGLIDRLNPELRAIDTFDGKTRTKEFYAMTKEDAYALLESIAKLSGTMDKLQRLTPEGHEVVDEEVAAEIQEEAKERKAPFSFARCGIPAGTEIVLSGHPEVVATVKDDRQIEYQGEIYSLSSLAQKILQTSYPLQGPVHWLYQGKKLSDIRREREAEGLYQ